MTDIKRICKWEMNYIIALTYYAETISGKYSK